MPVHLPLLRVSCYCYHFAVFNFRATLFTLTLLVYITRVFVISNELLAVLSSAESFYEIRSNSVHKRAVVASSDLTNMIPSSLLFVYW